MGGVGEWPFPIRLERVPPPRLEQASPLSSLQLKACSTRWVWLEDGPKGVGLREGLDPFVFVLEEAEEGF